jgi:hypothetical protein
MKNYFLIFSLSLIISSMAAAQATRDQIVDLEKTADWLDLEHRGDTEYMQIFKHGLSKLSLGKIEPSFIKGLLGTKAVSYIALENLKMKACSEDAGDLMLAALVKNAKKLHEYKKVLTPYNRPYYTDVVLYLNQIDGSEDYCIENFGSHVFVGPEQIKINADGATGSITLPFDSGIHTLRFIELQLHDDADKLMNEIPKSILQRGAFKFTKNCIELGANSFSIYIGYKAEDSLRLGNDQFFLNLQLKLDRKDSFGSGCWLFEE